jgi:cobalt-zinc-cadmium efflux system outer membrane protein
MSGATIGRTAYVIGLLATTFGVLQAQDPRGALTYEDALAAALRTNPDVRLARTTFDSSRAELRIARAYPNPFFQASPNTPFQYNLTLPIDVGPQRTFRVRAGVLGARGSADDVADAERQLGVAVAHAFADVLLADAEFLVSAQRREGVLLLQQGDAARARAGDISERAVTRSEIELARADADLARAGIDRQATRLALGALMGLATPDTALAVSGSLAYHPVTLDYDELVAQALRERPDVEATRVREEQSRALLGLARSAVIPIPQLTYSRQLTGPFESGHYYALGIGFEVPIANQYGGQRDRAAAGAEASSLVRRRLEAQVRRDVLDAVTSLRTQGALIERYEAGLLQKVQANVEATRYAYSKGATSLLDLMDAMRTQQEVASEYQRALHDHVVSRRVLEGRIGGAITR